MHLISQCGCRQPTAREAQQREVSPRHLCQLPRSSIWPRMDTSQCGVTRQHSTGADNNTSKTTWLRSPAFSLHLAGARLHRRRTRIIRTLYSLATEAWPGAWPRPTHHDLGQAILRAFCSYYASSRYGVLPSYSGRKMSPKNYHC